jgi:hypothetical protein
MSNVADQVTSSHRMAELVTKLKFGVITQSGKALNPKTGHVISCWTWLVDHEPFRAWYFKQKIAKLRNF